MLSSKKLSQILLSLVNKKGGTDEVVEGFISFLKEKKALYLLPAIREHLKRTHKDLLQKEEILVYTRYNLSENDLEEFKELMGIPVDVSVRQIQDETLLGGFLVIYDGHIYDGSLKGQVEHLKNTLTY